jgi:hypothetical protein
MCSRPFWTQLSRIETRLWCHLHLPPAPHHTGVSINTCIQENGEVDDMCWTFSSTHVSFYRTFNISTTKNLVKIKLLKLKGKK